MLDVIELCKNMIKCDNINVAKKALEEIGFKTEIFTFADKDGTTVENLYAEIGNSSPRLLFNGHYDVVPPGDLSLWKHPPFDAVIEDDVLYGRGICDMKGGIACFVAAVEEFVKSNKHFGTIAIILSGDEEEPIVDGTNKTLEAIYNQGKQFDFCIVGEPTNPTKIGESFKIGRRGDVVIRIECNGVQGHSAYPELAINPIHNLINLLHKLIHSPLDAGNKYFDKSTLQITSFDVGNKATNVIPQKAKAQIDIRFNSEHSSQSVIEFIKENAKSVEGDFVVEAKVDGESFLTEYNSDIKTFYNAVAKVTSIKPEASTSGGTSDARFVKNFCPVIEFGLINQTIHKINECAKISDIKLLKEIYLEFLQQYFFKK